VVWIKTRVEIKGKIKSANDIVTKKKRYILQLQCGHEVVRAYRSMGKYVNHCLICEMESRPLEMFDKQPEK